MTDLNVKDSKFSLVNREAILLMIAFIKGSLTKSCYLQLKSKYQFNLYPTLNDEYVYIETEKFKRSLGFIKQVITNEKWEFLKEQYPVELEDYPVTRT